MRILERPLTIECKVCSRTVKVGTRGPIPQFCAEHRGVPKKPKRKPPRTLELPRREIEGLRQSHADAVMRCRAALDELARERKAHWRTQEVLRDLRQDHAQIKAELRALTVDRGTGNIVPVEPPAGLFSAIQVTAMPEGAIDPFDLGRAAESVSFEFIPTERAPLDWGQDDLGRSR